MRTISLVLAALLGGCAITPLPTQPVAPFDGARLHAMMSGPASGQEAALAFVVGVSDAEAFYSLAAKTYNLPAPTQARMICFPEAARYQQGVDVVKQYIEANPGERHLSAYVLTRSALFKAWPCKT